jgi:ubiquinone/menaquinone biosynthesis C-methylase UbiE
MKHSLLDQDEKQCSATATEWDEHWGSLEDKRFLFSLGAKTVRRFIFQPAVSWYGEHYFPESGIFVEMGCGTAHSSAQLAKRQRTFVGLDFSAKALRAAKNEGRMDALVQADIFALPYQSNSIDGIWKLGVMEHFTQPEIRDCLQEFRRVLKPGGMVVLFWPTRHNSSRWILGPFEKLISLLTKTKFTYFPDEISRLRSRKQARAMMQNAGFEVAALDFNWRTAFIHMVIVARKPQSESDIGR